MKLGAVLGMALIVLSSASFAKGSGTWRVVNYWSPHCGACLEEMPALDRFAAKNKGKVSLIKINVEKNAGTGITTLPTTKIYNPQGKLVATLVGAQDESSFQAAIGG